MTRIIVHPEQKTKLFFALDAYDILCKNYGFKGRDCSSMLDTVLGSANRQTDYGPVVALTLEDITNGKATQAFRLEKQQSGNGSYTVVGYRSQRLQSFYSMLVLFVLTEEDTTTIDFIVRHNWFSKDEDVKETLDLFFKAHSPAKINELFQEMRRKGFILMPSISDMKLMINGLPMENKRPDQQKIFSLVQH